MKIVHLTPLKIFIIITVVSEIIAWHPAFGQDTPTQKEDQKLTASDGAMDLRFGTGISISGNNAIIGAHGQEILMGR